MCNYSNHKTSEKVKICTLQLSLLPWRNLTIIVAFIRIYQLSTHREMPWELNVLGTTRLQSKLSLLNLLSVAS